MATTSSYRWLPASLLFLLDAGTLALGVIVAVRIRFLPQFFAHELNAILSHPGFLLYVLAAQFALATTFNLYRPATWRTRELLLVGVAAHSFTLPVAFSLGVYLVPSWRFGRGVLLLTLVTALVLQLCLRLLWKAWGIRQTGRQAVLVGDGPIVPALLDELETRPWPPFKIADRLTAEDFLGDSAAIDHRLSQAELLIVAGLRDPAFEKRIAALNFCGTPVVDAAAAYADLTGRIPVQQVDSRWFIATGDFSGLADTPFHHLQRMFDILAAATLLLLSTPVVLFAAVSILATSGFPVFYRQVRLGRYRRPFTLVKLRTMRDSAEKNGPQFAEAGDARVLPLGRFLRRWRIDEIPQLVNVLKGEMSLVGPRPERPELTEDLERAIPFFGFRYSIRPGLTGWAQVNQPYCAALDDHRVKLEYDLYSLRHHGPAMYALVLIHTLGALIFRPGR